MRSVRRLKCVSLLQNKTRSLSINHLKQIHAHIITNAFESVSILASLIQHYCSSSSPQATNYAHLILNNFSIPNIYLLNVLIRCTLPDYSIRAFADWNSRSDINFDDSTYIFALGACARCSRVSALFEGKQIYARILKHGFFSNVMLQTTCIHFYSNKGDIVSARKVFDEMRVRTYVTWNSLIAGYCVQIDRVNENARYALMLFRDMLVEGSGVEPTETTMVCVLSAASRLGVLETGACIHGRIEKTIDSPNNNVYIGTGLVDMYSKCGNLDIAMSIFNNMKEKNVLTWTAMTTGLAIHGKGNQALQVFDEMSVHGINPNAVTFTSLLSACCYAGLVEEGLRLFNSMEKFNIKPLIQHYGCIVDLLGRLGYLKEAYEFIIGMNVEKDAVLWRSLLNSCNVHGDIVMGENVAKILLKIQPRNDLVPDIVASEDYIALSNVYASAERWEDVENVRRQMKAKSIETKPGSSSVYSLNN